MSYYFSKIVPGPFEQAVERATAALRREGFGIVSEIDLQRTLREKLGAELRPYRILGACNPHMAYAAVQLEAEIGTLLPCNVIVRELDAGRIEVAAVDPVASMRVVDNAQLRAIAVTVRDALQRTLDGL